MSLEYDYLFKLLIIGDAGVGKSSIVKRFNEDIFSNDTLVSTVGVEMSTKSIELNDKIIKLHIWDTPFSSQRTLTSSYYRGAHGIIIVYDVNNPESFKNLNHWLEEIDRYALDDVHKLIIGNKSDLELIRKVQVKDAMKFSEVEKISDIETSAKSGFNVNEAFDLMALKIMSKNSHACENRSSGSEQSVGSEQPNVVNVKIGRKKSPSVPSNCVVM